MPKTLTTRIVLNTVKLESITLIEADGALQAIASYRVLRDDGSTHEVKRLGEIPVPDEISKTVQNWWAELSNRFAADEGL